MKRKHSIATLACVAPLLLSPALFAAASGLDAVDENRVMTELANRGLETLLKREFTLQKVPVERQNGVITLISLRQLTDPAAKLSATQRRDLIEKVSKGITAALPAMSDPKLLMEQATTLMKVGVDPDVNALEYFGHNNETAARLLPTVTAVRAILSRAADAAGQSADKLANQMTDPNDTAMANRWQAMTNLQASAAFTDNMEAYDLCLAMPAGDPAIAKAADAAIDYLKQFDNKDSDVMAAVRNRTAKLQMVKGDFAAAAKGFGDVATNPDNVIQPAPNPSQQYEARYFTAVADIGAKKLDEADKAMNALDSWQKANLTPAEQKGASAAYTMLQYRLLSAKADAATEETEKKKDDTDAMSMLIGLVKDRPDLRGVIFDQLTARMPANPDVAQLDPLLLLALQQKGEQEFLKPEGQSLDTKVMDQAIAAAREIVKRQGQPGVDAGVAAQSARVLPYLLQREGKNAEAAAAFLDFAEKFKTDAAAGSDALDHATALIGELRRSDPQDQDTRALYDRFLPIAIAPPYDRKQFAFEYGLLLEREQHYADAVTYLSQVSPSDPRALSARFYTLFALKQRLTDPADEMSADQRKALATQIQPLADDVNKQASAALASATTDGDRQRFKSMLASTALIAADLSLRELKDPTRTVALLDGFEQKVHGSSTEQDQLGEALFLRVNAYMDLGKSTEATNALVQLLQTKKGDDGPALVFDLLKKLDVDMDQARAKNDTAEVAQLAGNRAALSGFLVSWAENNADPKIKALTPRYKAFDASTQQLAAELNPDPAARKAGLEAALKRYKDLLDPAAPDPAVQLGLGLVSYDLGDFKTAEDNLSPLVVNKKLGRETQVITENGAPKVVDNAQYWEAVLRLLQSTAKVAEQNPNDAAAQKNLDDAKTYLKQLYVEWPKTIGGQKYHDDFETLRTQLVPDFHVEPVIGTGAATQPAA